MPDLSRRRFARARQDTMWFDVRSDILAPLVSAIATAIGVYLQQRTDAAPELGDVVAPATAGIVATFAYWLVLNAAEYLWRFAQATTRNELDDYKAAAAAVPDEVEQVVMQMKARRVRFRGIENSLDEFLVIHNRLMWDGFTQTAVEYMLEQYPGHNASARAQDVIYELQLLGLVYVDERVPRRSEGMVVYPAHLRYGLTPLGRKTIARVERDM